MPNIELLQKTLEYIKTHPKEWDQAQWHCGSTFCFAGHACNLAGLKLVVRDGEVLSGEEFIATEEHGFYNLRHIKAVAREALELDMVQAEELFAPRNTLPVIEIMVENLVEGRHITSGLPGRDVF